MAEIQDIFSNLQHTFYEYRNLPSLLSALSFQLQGTRLRGHLDRNLPNRHRTSGANQVSLASHLAYNFLSKKVQVSCRTHDLPAALWMLQVPQGISKSTRHWCISTWLLPHELQGKRGGGNCDTHPPFLSHLWTEFLAQTGEASEQLFPNCTQLQSCQRTAILHPSIVRIQRHPTWTSFLLSQQYSISHIMVLVATRNSADSFQKEPSQIIAAWIMEQKLKEKESVTEGSLIL